jgi:hypothetical protein
MNEWITGGYYKYLKRVKKGYSRKTFNTYLATVTKEQSAKEAFEELYWQTITLAFGLQGALQRIDDVHLEKIVKRAGQIVEKYRPKKKGKKK